MGFVGDILTGGNAGVDYQAPNADQLGLTYPVGQQQADKARQDTDYGLGQQNNFLQALQAQGGLQNQSSVYNQQQSLANQLQSVVNGGGPDPVGEQFNQDTAKNIAAQNALMAGQRGASSNVGLLARQAAQTGAGMQQAATGQKATQEANQQYAAYGALQNQLNSMGNLAGTQANQLGSALTNYSSAAQNNQGQLLGAINQGNATRVNMQSNINNANAGIANTNAQGQQKIAAGLVGGAAAMMARGGAVKKFDDGGDVSSDDESGDTNSIDSSSTEAAPDTSSSTANFSGTSDTSGGDSGLGPQQVGAPPSGGGSNSGANALGDMMGGGAAKTAMKMLPLLLMLLNKGGEVPKVHHYDGGGDVNPDGKDQNLSASLRRFGQGFSNAVGSSSQPQSFVGSYLQGGNKTSNPASNPRMSGSDALGQSASNISNGAVKGVGKLISHFNSSAKTNPQGSVIPTAGTSGTTPEGLAADTQNDVLGKGDLSSVGDEAPAQAADSELADAGSALADDVEYVSKGGAINGEGLAAALSRVPGKASKKGNSLKNDTVPAMLSPGEVVIPRSVMNSRDPVGNASKFVAAVLARKGNKK